MQGQLQEAALLGLAVGDVEPVQEGFHAAVGAPQRQGQGEHEGHAQGRAARLGNADHLGPDEHDRVVRDHRGKGLDLFHGVVEVGEQTVEGHERRQAWKQGQKGEEGHPASHREDVVLVELLERAPEDVAPAARRDLPRRAGRAPSPRLQRQHPPFDGGLIALGLARPEQQQHGDHQPRGGLQVAGEGTAGPGRRLGGGVSQLPGARRFAAGLGADPQHSLERRLRLFGTEQHEGPRTVLEQLRLHCVPACSTRRRAAVRACMNANLPLPR